MIGELIAAFLGTVAFGYLFGIPRRYFVYSGLCGSVAWGVYSLPVWGSEVIASFAATVLVAVFLIAGMIPLVPGIGLYWTFYYLVTNQLEQMSATGLVAVKSACAIVLGIVFVFEIPQKFFRMAARGEKGKK